MFTFKYIGQYNITELKEKILSLDEALWLEHTERQIRAPVHARTNTLEILWHWGSLLTGEIGRKHSNFDRLGFEQILRELYPIYEAFYGSGEFQRVLLTRLPGGASIAEHSDSGSSLSLSYRTHVAIVTNPDVLFFVGGECRNMKEGEIWEIDNTNLHSVENRSSQPRIHLIIDYLVTSSRGVDAQSSG
jgi:hypothetical protein